MLPAVAQGAIGIQCRENDPTFEKYLAGLCHQETKVRKGPQDRFIEGRTGRQSEAELETANSLCGSPLLVRIPYLRP